MSRRERIVIGTTTGVVVLLVGGGFLLPGEAAHSVATTTSAPPELIFELVNSPLAWAAWAGSEATPSPGSSDQGVGSFVTWRVPDGQVLVLELTASSAYTGIEYREVGGSVRRGHITIEPNGSGSHITWEDRRRLSRGPLARWTAFFESPPMAESLSALTDVAAVWHEDMKPPELRSQVEPIIDPMLSSGAGAVYEGQ